MASGENWEPETLFNLYMHDYMVRKKMKRSASIFKHEARLPDHSVAIDDSQNGLLHDWWSIFWDVFANRHFGNNKEKPEDSLQVMQSHNSTQPHLAIGGQMYGPSFGTPRLNIPNAVRMNSSPLSTQVDEGFKMIARGRVFQTMPISSGSRDHTGISRSLNPEPLNGLPVNAPNRRQQLPLSTHGSQTSSPRNSADYNSNLKPYQQWK